MGLFSKLDRHADLMHRMADSLGVDLSAAVVRGTLAPEGLRAAVMSCTACEGGSRCGDWLDNHPAGSGRTPGYCRNQEMLGRLREAAGH